MKRILVYGLVLVMALTCLTGCKVGGNKSSKYLLDIKYSDYVKLCDYKGVEATKVDYEVTDEDVMEEIQYGLYDYATYDSVTDRGIEVGDYAIVTYTTKIDGTVDENYSGEEEEILVGEGYIYPEVEDALIGLKTGDSKDVKVVLSEEYAEDDMVGKEAVVSVKVDDVTVENLPEYNLDFVKENTEFDSMKKYEESIKEQLIESKEEEYKYVAVEEIFTYINENSTFNGYPEELYNKCEKLYDESNEYYAAMYGMELEEFLEAFGIDEETKKSEVEMNVNYELVVGAIAQKEGIDCTDKEVDEFIEEIYMDYGYDSKEDFLTDYSKEEMGYELIYQKVSDYLYEKAFFNKVPEEEFLQEQEEAMEMEELSDDELPEGEEEVDDEELSAESIEELKDQMESFEFEDEEAETDVDADVEAGEETETDANEQVEEATE